ncbi:hypothetical protein QZH56_13425 [Streptomyces olivoreticuli]|uniref:hypothetical protein n=1 Tax=Streptomyces olivoreticuli TaxID=68246 RepID=UPI002659ABEB|nr:hypothetical protein [Streptomyces olivoreticuli]WKK26497.1 hypothetical protein QZH56_13425 [Streptomyces olivoreticuli]
MVTSRHEASHRIFQERPELLAPVFRLLGVPLPAKAAVEVLTADVTEIRPLERRVDSVLRIEPIGDGKSDGGGGFLLAIEAQGRQDRAKPVSWAYYMSFLKAKYACPVLLLVVCHDKATADWAAGPFRLGVEDWTSLSVHPLVMGPGNVPVITDPEEAAEDLAMATFSAMTHGSSEDAPAILDALARALGAADPESSTYYSELLEIGLGDSRAGETWRKLMPIRTYFPGRGTMIELALQEGETKGRAEERAQMVLRVLETREVAVTPEVRERVVQCADLDMLGRWLDRAFVVSRAEEIFDE